MNPTLVRRTRHSHLFGRWPNVGFKNPTYVDSIVKLLYFVRLFFRMGISAYLQLIPEVTHPLVSGYLKCSTVIAELDSAIHWLTK